MLINISPQLDDEVACWIYNRSANDEQLGRSDEIVTGRQERRGAPIPSRRFDFIFRSLKRYLWQLYPFSPDRRLLDPPR